MRSVFSTGCRLARAFAACGLLIAASQQASALPPLPEDAAAYAPNAVRYTTVDGKEFMSINPHAARWVYTYPRPPVPTGVLVPTDIPPYGESFGPVTSCGDAQTLCIEFSGIAVSLSRAVKPEQGAKWQAGGRSFEASVCLARRGEQCRLRVIEFAGGASKGWYAWSPERGVEAFALAGPDGRARTTFLLTSETGLLH